MRYLIISEEKAAAAGLPMLGRYAKNGMCIATEKECMALPLASEDIDETARALGGYACGLSRAKELLKEGNWKYKLSKS